MCHFSQAHKKARASYLPVEYLCSTGEKENKKQMGSSCFLHRSVTTWHQAHNKRHLWIPQQEGLGQTAIKCAHHGITLSHAGNCSQQPYPSWMGHLYAASVGNMWHKLGVTFSQTKERAQLGRSKCLNLLNVLLKRWYSLGGNLSNERQFSDIKDTFVIQLLSLTKSTWDTVFLLVQCCQKGWCQCKTWRANSRTGFGEWLVGVQEWKRDQNMLT